MGLFRPYSQPGEQQTVQDTAVTDDAAKTSDGKASPTLTRRQAEAMRREQLRPTLSKQEQKARARRRRREKENEAFAAMEMRPERVLMRNFIDSRWTFSEFSWPLIFLALAVFMFGGKYPAMTFYGTYVLWAIMAAIIAEVAFMWFRYRRVLDQRLPFTPRRGLLMSMASRMVTMRRFRRPPTAIDRGADY